MTTLLTKARQLAQQLNAQRVDVNEVEKVLAYARCTRDMGKLRDIVGRLAEQDVIVYSNRTKRYAQAIQDVMIPALPRDAEQALELLGWTVRMMRYERTVSGSRREGR